MDEAVLEVIRDLPHDDLVDVAGLTPVTALVDRRHLDQILTNLLTNAHKYGGGAVAVSCEDALHDVLVRISDSGPGVPDSFVSQLFDRFTRSEAARSSTQKGTGLGLYITRSLLLANEGDIHYEPTRGGGSTFCLRLPRCDVPTGAQGGGSGPRQGLRSR